MNKQRYLITGIRGQDGRIAADLLNNEGHVVAGLSHSKVDNDVTLKCSKIWHWNWVDESSLVNIITEYKPDCLLNFAAYHLSSNKPLKNIDDHQKMMDVNIAGLFVILKVLLKHSPDTKIVHASSSQIYTPTKQNHLVNESTPTDPPTFYGYTKEAGMKMIDFYRREYKMNGGSAIFFNHESEFRGKQFVTREISSQIAKIKLGVADKLKLRNIGACGDFTSAYDSVSATIQICKKDKLDNFIISSGKATSIKELVRYGFESVDLDWRNCTTIDNDETTNYLIGDNTKIRNELNWYPVRNMRSVMEKMVRIDMEILKKQIQTN